MSYGDQVPKTIRDAMHVTVAITHRYLWVDALSIPQDGHDVQETLNAMSLIYANAECTIVVASESDGVEGIDGLKANGQPRSQPSSFIEFPDMTVVARTHGGPGLRQTPWSQRGGTLQEGTFSRRILCFSENMHWKCWKVERTEGGRNQFVGGTSKDIRTSFMKAVALCKINAVSTENFDRQYMDLVEKMSCRSFKYSEDITHALAGISGILERLHGRPMNTLFLHEHPMKIFESYLVWARRGGCMYRRSFEGQNTLLVPTWSITAWIDSSEKSVHEIPQLEQFVKVAATCTSCNLCTVLSAGCCSNRQLGSRLVLTMKIAQFPTITLTDRVTKTWAVAHPLHSYSTVGNYFHCDILVEFNCLPEVKLTHRDYGVLREQCWFAQISIHLAQYLPHIWQSSLNHSTGVAKETSRHDEFFQTAYMRSASDGKVRGKTELRKGLEVRLSTRKYGKLLPVKRSISNWNKVTKPPKANDEFTCLIFWRRMTA